MAGSRLDYSSLATSMVKMVSFMDMVLLNMNMLTDKALPSCPPRPDRIQANDLRDEISYRSDFKSNKYKTPKFSTQDFGEPVVPSSPKPSFTFYLSIIGFVESRLAEAEPDMFPLSSTFMVNTVSSMDMAFLYMYLRHFQKFVICCKRKLLQIFECYKSYCSIMTQDAKSYYMLIVPPTDEGFHDQDQVSVDSSSFPVQNCPLVNMSIHFCFLNVFFLT